MEFRNPYFLLLLIPVFIAAIILHFNRKNFARAKVSHKMPAVQTLRLKIFNIIPPLLKISALALICIALARPAKVLRTQIPPAEGVDIMLVLDTSYSMAEQDFVPNRLEAAKYSASSFVKKRSNDRIGLVVFGGVALLSCPLTWDYQSLLESISSASLDMTLEQGTAIGDAIVTSVNHLKNSKAKSKVMILLTDGRSNVGIVTDMALAAKTAKTFGIKIYTIGTADQNSSLSEDSNLDEPSLREIASITGGKFYKAKNTWELSNIYSQIDSLEKTKFEVKTTSSYTDIYSVFLWLALILYLLAIISERTIFRCIP